MPRRWLLQNLQFRVLLTMVVSIAAVLTVVTAFSISVSRARLISDMLKLGQSYTTILSHAASVYLAQQDSHQLGLIAQAATEADLAEFAAFYSTTDSLLAAGASPSAADAARTSFASLLAEVHTRGELTSRWQNNYLEVGLPVVYQGQPAGTIALRINSDKLAESLGQEISRGIITTLVLILLLSLAIGLMLRRLVIGPLARLNTAAEQVSAGSWVQPDGLERNDEFGTVARSFSQMVGALQAREAQLHEQVQAVEALNADLDSRVAERTRALNELVDNQQQLLAQIRSMSTPVVPVLEGVIVLPIIGSLDSRRASQLIGSMLTGIEQQRAELAVLDITGVPVVDTHVAQVLVQAANAARFLGAAAVLVGIRPEVAQTLVQLGVSLEGIRTFATLQDALSSTIAQRRRR